MKDVEITLEVYYLSEQGKNNFVRHISSFPSVSNAKHLGEDEFSFHYEISDEEFFAIQDSDVNTILNSFFEYLLKYQHDIMISVIGFTELTFIESIPPRSFELNFEDFNFKDFIKSKSKSNQSISANIEIDTEDDDYE